MRKLLTLAAAMGALGVSAQNLQWDWNDFELADPATDSPYGVNAFYYPNPSEPGSFRSTAHSATPTRVASTALGSTVLRLDWVLDGAEYPAAGVGFMFPGAGAADFSHCLAAGAGCAIVFDLNMHAERELQVTLGSKVGDYETGANQGRALGWFEAVPAGLSRALTLSFPPAYPTWARCGMARPDALCPTTPTDSVLRAIDAVQFGVSCGPADDGVEGTCANAPGWFEIDNLTLVGLGPNGTQLLPPVDSAPAGVARNLFTDFATNEAAFGGYAYVFTDVEGGGNSAIQVDTSRAGDGSGLALFQDAADLEAFWFPNGAARVVYELDNNGNRDMGTAALGVQAGPPDGEGLPSPYDYTGLRGVIFTLKAARTADVATMSFKINTADVDVNAGHSFQHQFLLPADTVARTYYIDISKLAQPPWVEEGLRAPALDLTLVESFVWEVKSRGSTGSGWFEVSNVQTVGTLVNNGPLATRASQALSARYAAGALNLRYTLPTDASWNTTVSVLGLDGRVITSAPATLGAMPMDLPNGNYMVVVRAEAAGRAPVSLVSNLAVVR